MACPASAQLNITTITNDSRTSLPTAHGQLGLTLWQSSNFVTCPIANSGLTRAAFYLPLSFQNVFATRWKTHSTSRAHPRPMHKAKKKWSAQCWLVACGAVCRVISRQRHWHEPCVCIFDMSWKCDWRTWACEMSTAERGRSVLSTAYRGRKHLGKNKGCKTKAHLWKPDPLKQPKSLHTYGLFTVAVPWQLYRTWQKRLTRSWLPCFFSTHAYVNTLRKT